MSTRPTLRSLRCPLPRPLSCPPRLRLGARARARLRAAGLAAVALLALGLTACEPPDSDGDGVEDELDACAGTPEGARVVEAGCSATDLVLRPEALVGDAFERFERLHGLTEPDGSTVLPPDAATALLEGELQLHEALDRMRFEGPCAASPAWSGAVDAVAAADGVLQGFVAGLARQIPVPTEESVDVDEASTRYLAWRLEARRLGEALERLGLGHEVVSGLCRDFATGQEVTGEVESFDPGSRILRFRDGPSVVMARDAVFEEGLADGARVSADVWMHANGDLLGKSTALFPSEWPFIPGLSYDLCLQLRIAPIQPKPLNGIWIEHPTYGYEDGGRLHLEQGMRVGAEGAGCPGVLEGQGPNGEDVLLKYHYQVELTYRTEGGSWKTTTLAPQLGHGSEPVKLPQDANASWLHTLTATKYKRTCTPDPTPEFPGDFNCSSPQPVLTQSYDVYLYEPYTQCTATLNTTVFDLEDDEPNAWRSATVVNAGISSPGVSFVQFQARARKIVNGTPFNAWIGVGEPFAIYSEDPFPLYGTDNAAGLQWPNATGTRNGQPFRYSCSVPEIVRDVIDYCPGTDTFYRLPFLQGQSTQVTQGNGGSFTHDGWQWFALDFSGLTGAPLVAARGGEVVDVVSDVAVNCQATPYPGCPAYGNYVAIEHQDGDISWALHMVTNSPMVSVGQQVKRGDWIGLLGNTGNSTGPHTHFHVTPAGMPNTTADVRYEFQAAFPPTGSCVVPLQGQIVTSTNG